MSIGAGKRLKFGLKRLFTFTQGRIDARRYIRTQQRVLDRANRGLERRVNNVLNRATFTFAKAAESSTAINTGPIIRQMVAELTSVISAQASAIFRMVYEENNQRYQSLQTKGADAVFGEAFSGLDAEATGRVGTFIFSRSQTYEAIAGKHMVSLQNALGKGIQQGIGVDKIAKSITEEVRSISRRRAALIARTESHSALGYAQDLYHHEVSKEYGIQMKKQWVATGDARTRSAHAQMNGREVPMDDAFLMPNGTNMRYPGDPAGGAANVINCRCVVLYVDTDDEIVDDQTPPPENDQGIPVDSIGRPIGLSADGMQKKYGSLSVMERNREYEQAKRSIKDSVEEGANTWGEFKAHTIYSGRSREMIGKVSNAVTGSMQGTFALSEMVRELNVLSDTLKVPRLRGITAISGGSRALANMGDGIMGINTQYIGRLAGLMAQYGYGKLARSKSSWKLGDDLASRPWTADSYFDDAVDVFRSTIYHEFGHLVHQTYKIGDYADYRRPPVEKWMKSKRLRGTAATRYSDTNNKEWFAENFSLWAMGRDEMVSPRFKKLIQTIISGELPDGKT